MILNLVFQKVMQKFEVNPFVNTAYLIGKAPVVSCNLEHFP